MKKQNLIFLVIGVIVVYFLFIKKSTLGTPITTSTFKNIGSSVTGNI
jgi:hypothetical protein